MRRCIVIERSSSGARSDEQKVELRASTCSYITYIHTHTHTHTQIHIQMFYGHYMLGEFSLSNNRIWRDEDETFIIYKLFVVFDQILSLNWPLWYLLNKINITLTDTHTHTYTQTDRQTDTQTHTHTCINPTCTATWAECYGIIICCCLEAK